MKTMKSRFVEAACGVRNRWRFFAICGLMLVSGAAHAALLEWDSNGTTEPNPQGGSGTWQATSGNLNWWNGSTNVVWNNSNNDDAQFPTTTLANKDITVVGSITVNDIVMSGKPYFFQTGTGGQMTINGTLTGNSMYWFNVPIVGASVIDYSGTDTVELLKVNSYTGATTINSGKLIVSANGALGDTSTGTTVVSGATLALRTNYTNLEPLTINGIGKDGGGALRGEQGSRTFAGPITLGSNARLGCDSSNNPLTVTGDIGDNGNNYQLSILEGSAVVLSGNNTYGGGTQIGVNGAGILQISSEANLGAVPTTGAVKLTVNRGSTLRVTADVELHANRWIQIPDNDAKFDIDEGVVFTVNGRIYRGGGGSFIKQGLGTMVLKGNPPTDFPLLGQITVSAGTLLVSNTSGSGTGGGAVVVNSGATLGGTGIIGPSDTAGITADAGATVAPGASIGTLRLSGASTTGAVLTMASGAAFNFEVAGDGSGADQIELWNYVAGDLALNSTAINLDVLGTPIAGQRTYTVTLFEFFSDAGTTLTASGISSGLVLGTLDPRIYSAELVYNTNSIDLVYSIPEPASLALLGLGAVALLHRRRR